MGHQTLLKRKRHAKRDACYVAPAANANITAFASTQLQWNPSCFPGYDKVDIYLYSVNGASNVHIWKGVPTNPPTLDTALNPTWWSSTTGATPLQLVITGADQPSWAGEAPGPVFTANFDGNVPAANATTSATPSATNGPSIDNVSPTDQPKGGLSAGQLAAAIAVPLVVVAIALGAYIWWSRRRTGQASKRWSAYVDQRMSVISSNWQPSVGHARNASQATFASNRAGVGAVPRAPEMAQTRQPRVSFASDTRRSQPRLSQLQLPSRLSRANAEFALSPSQEDGPRVLDDRSLGSALSNHSQKPSLGGRSLSNLRFELSSSPETSAAVTMSSVINGAELSTDIDAEELSNDASIEHHRHPSVGTSADGSASGTLGHGSASGMRRLSNVRTSTLSPDEALRAYTLARKGGKSSPPASTKGMRVLYSPPAAQRNTTVTRPSVYSDASRYSSASVPQSDDREAELAKSLGLAR